MNKLIDYINSNYSFRDEYLLITGKSLPPKKCMCCFHDNHDTPAAAMYGNYMYCFVERRKFGVYDLWKKFCPDKINQVKSSVFIPEYPSSVTSKGVTCLVDRNQSINTIVRNILSK